MQCDNNSSYYTTQKSKKLIVSSLEQLSPLNSCRTQSLQKRIVVATTIRGNTVCILYVDLSIYTRKSLACTLLYLNRQVYSGWWHCQTILPTENFNSMNLLQMSCMITRDPKKSASNLKKNEAVYTSKINGQGKSYKHTQSHKVFFFVIHL